MSRVFSKATNEITFAVGIGGNLYVWSLDKQQLVAVCDQINKSVSSIYFNEKHSCWAIRIKSKIHKEKFICMVGGMANAHVCKT